MAELLNENEYDAGKLQIYFGFSIKLETCLLQKMNAN